MYVCNPLAYHVYILYTLTPGRAQCMPRGPDLWGVRLVGGAHAFPHLPPLLSHRELCPGTAPAYLPASTQSITAWQGMTGSILSSHEPSSAPIYGSHLCFFCLCTLLVLSLFYYFISIYSSSKFFLNWCYSSPEHTPPLLFSLTLMCASL